MCKLAIITKISPVTQKRAWQFAKAIRPFMTAYDNDGFGYMGLGDKGLFGERWLYPNQAFQLPNTLGKGYDSLLSEYRGVIEPIIKHSGFGVKSDNVSCLALHARMATSDKGLINTHPFVTSSGNTALIHNGVIHLPDKALMPTSTCDSEAILTLYDQAEVRDNLRRIDNVVDNLDGYYACAVITRSTQGAWYLDIIKDNSAQLFAVYVKPLKCLVFCTSPEHVYAACKKLHWQYEHAYRVKDNTITRLNAETGHVIEALAFDPYVDKYEKLDYSKGWSKEYPDYSTKSDHINITDLREGTTPDDGPEEDIDEDYVDLVDVTEAMVRGRYE